MLTDNFGRKHNYLRISLTERCNLRCFYCMPAEGVALSPTENIMTASEIITIAKKFVDLGVTKIRLTGGEPMVRKDFSEIVESLSSLPVSLAITTNGILIDQYIDLFTSKKIEKINISIDTLNKEKFNNITRRNYFDRVIKNINTLLQNNIIPKLNVVLIKGVNDDEIVDFISLTKKWPVTIQFIEYMPFTGNKWDLSKCVSMSEILEKVNVHFGAAKTIKLLDEANSTSKNYQIENFLGKFGIVSTVTNPFCDSCNRIRLTANGRIKNCLFSGGEVNLLQQLRLGNEMEPVIREALNLKKEKRGGMLDFNSSESVKHIKNNRSMVMIGG